MFCGYCKSPPDTNLDVRTRQCRNGAVSAKGSKCSLFSVSLGFICSPWRPVVGRTDRQEKDGNPEDLARDQKWEDRPPKPAGLSQWEGRRDPQLGLFDTEY